MDGPYRLVSIGDALSQVLDEIPIELGYGVTDRVGNVNGGGALGNHGFEHATEKVRVRTVPVLRRKLDVTTQVAGKPHRQPRLLQHLLPAHAQFLLHVQFAGGDEGVNARRGRTLQRLGGAANVTIIGAGKGTHRAVLDDVRNGFHGFEVAVAGSRKAGLDHIHPKPFQLPCDAQLFLPGHGRARRLFAVTQGGVEDEELVGHESSPGQGCKWVVAGTWTGNANGPLREAGGPSIQGCCNECG